MPILTLPNTLRPSKVTWRMRPNKEKHTSPLNGATQTTSRPGTKWRATLEFSGLTLERGTRLDAWLASLDVMGGRFYVYPYHRPGHAGAGVVSAITATTVSVSGMTVGIGDFIEAGGELKMITSDGNPLGVTPAWRRQPPIGTVVNGTRPMTVMILEEDETGVTRLPGRIYDNVIINCIEDFQ